MLVLSRKVGEAVVIAGGIVVRVLDASGGRIRLGVDAPEEVLILREEIAARLDVPSRPIGIESARVACRS